MCHGSGGRSRFSGFGREPDVLALVVDRQPLRRAGVAVVGQVGPDGVVERRAGEQRAVGAGDRGCSATGTAPRRRTNRGSRRTPPASGACPRASRAPVSSTASNSAWPAWRAFSLSTRNDSQLGRNEYCIDTIAVLPLYMYSSADASASLIQPVPVVVATATTARSSPPVRSSSCGGQLGGRLDVVGGVEARRRRGSVRLPWRR